MGLNKLDYKKIAIPGLLILGAGALLYAFRPVRIPAYADVVEDFDLEKYMGEWYEIARFDFKHEKNLQNVTARYTLNENGTVQVVNRGFNTEKQEWEEATGKAKPNGPPDRAALKVSFFGPFYSGYNVVMMSPDYQNALVFGESRDYIWMLSRKKSMSTEVKKKFLQKANEAGYDLERLVWTEQEANETPQPQAESPSDEAGGESASDSKPTPSATRKRRSNQLDAN